VCKSITWGKLKLEPLLGYKENLKPEPMLGYRETLLVENAVLDCVENCYEECHRLLFLKLWCDSILV
jgi:hypothetical protein